jgi:SAM-dependent methyltransferase
MASTLDVGNPAPGCGARGLERVIEESRLFGELTDDVLRRAGVGAGMRVLDAGCGSGDVAFLAAALVGAQGWVTGVDRDPEALALAQGRAAIARVANVRFLQADVELDELDGCYDAVIARLLLVHLRDPAEVLARLARSVRPGGLVVVHELVLSSARTVPALPLYARVHGWIHDSVAASGLDPDLGVRLARLFADAGLPAPELTRGARVAHPEEDDVHWFAAATMRSLLPLAERAGVTCADEVDVDTLAARLGAEARAAGAAVYMPDLVGAWARVPA